MQETSLLAYKKIKSELSNRQKDIVSMFKKLRWPVTNAELSRIIKLPVNCITGRVLELRNKNILIADRRRRCHATGFEANTWKLNTGENDG